MCGHMVRVLAYVTQGNLGMFQRIFEGMNMEFREYLMLFYIYLNIWGKFYSKINMSM